MESGPIIDTHVLLVADDPWRYPFDPAAAPFAPGEAESLTRQRALVAALDEGAFAGAVLVQRVRTHGFDNRLVCDLAAADPRLRALVAVGPVGEGAASLLGRPGVAGLRLMEQTKGQGAEWLSGPAARAQWAAAEVHGAVVDVHAYPWNRAMVLTELDRLAGDYPGARVLLDNLGADPCVPPGASLRPLARHANLALKFSAITLARIADAGIAAADAIGPYLDAFGADRLLWGSDVLPVGITLAQANAHARAALSALPQTQRAALLHGNAARLFGLAQAPVRVCSE